MKITAQLLVVTLVVHLLAPLPVLAQQTGEGSIGQLREQIARLEKIDSDPETSPEVKAMNREFLEERRARLSALVSRRVSALRRYLVAAGDALSPQERQAVENNIRALDEAPRGPRPAAEAAAVSDAKAGAGLSPSPAPAPALYSVGNAVYSGSLLSPARESVSAPQGEARPAGGTKVKVNVLEIPMNPRPLAIPTPMLVENETSVVVTGSKKFVDTCEVSTKREELKPEPSPFAQILKILTGLGPIPLGDIETPACVDAFKPTPKDPKAILIEEEMEALRLTLARIAPDINLIGKIYGRVSDQVSAFADCKAVRFRADDEGVLHPVTKDDAGDEYLFDETICRDVAAFRQAKKDLKPQVEAAVSLNFPDRRKVGERLGPDKVARLVAPFPSLESAELQMTALKEAISVGYKKEEAWVQNVYQRLECYSRTLDEARKDRARLLDARAEFESFLKLLARYDRLEDEDISHYRKELIVDSNAKLTGTVVCTNDFTKRPSSEPIPFTVTYQPFSRHALTAGVLFSTLGRRQIGVLPVFAGPGDNNSVTTRLTFTETDTSEGQVIPFTFYNYRLWGGRKFNFNASAGVGVNPGNGPVQVEFFAGGALGIRNVFVQIGGHAGRWQELDGGFTIGDLLPVGAGAPTVPIERRYTIRPAVGVSYKMPLP